ncbi:helicase-related protein [Pigmentibacter sp. JX0631]|uniref:helicase-related protein n=1 Tax=Pigmentibacter sp. JX0631 TaxID=2976982 RepID=UPI00246981CF|nr:helicase-related protein [Pigmentibacter sp. JX0631]WGL58851.1 helicase-related protein [Pigmentibacter sp. JX0631]
MTRMTKKKEVSEAKAEKSTKTKAATSKASKASGKAESSAVKTKKTESPKAVKQEKTVKKPAAPKVAEKTAAKKEKAAPKKVEKVTKVETSRPVKPTPAKKESPVAVKAKVVKEVAYHPQETLFPELAIAVSEKEILPNEPKKQATDQHFPIIATEQKIEILQASSEPVPAYFIPEVSEQNKKVIKYENIIANDFIIEALKKAGHKEPNETLQKALSATLRGSDVLIIKPKLKESFLVGSVASAAKILAESLPKGNIQAPSVLFLCNSDNKCEEIYTLSKHLLKSLGISLAKAIESENELSSNESFDVLLATPKTLHKFIQNKTLKLKQVGLCVCYDTHGFTQEESLSDLEKILGELPAERTQKVIIANENAPNVRELAFKFMEEPEYVNTLPSQVKERNPKQFAHSLQAVQKFQVLLGHLKTHKPSCTAIFANTKTVAEWIAFKLHGNGIKVELVTSPLNLSKRKNLVKAIHSGEVNAIVTTDVLSKNLGIKELNCIYNFDLPNSPEQFMERLSRIEGTKNPIAVSFICEDYGFNIKAIETSLGFKLHIATPDKNYFNLKDTSEYPLEASGKVKRIGVSYEQEIVATPVEESMPSESFRTALKKEDTVPTESFPKVGKKIHLESIAQKESATSSASVASSATTSASQTKLYPRPESEQRDEAKTQAFQQKPFDANRKSNYQQASKQTDGSLNRQADKFARRDERAKEAIDAARMAAKAASDKRKDRGTQKTTNPPKRPSLMNIMVSLVQDAVQSAAFAAKESVAQNIQENLPTLSNVLDRFNILKKPLKPGDEDKKNPQ